MFRAVGVLLDYLRTDYSGSLARIESLIPRGEITFDILYAILIPNTIIVTECPSTGEPHALRVLSATKVQNRTGPVYTIMCEGIDSAGEGAHPGHSDQPTPPPSQPDLLKAVMATFGRQGPPTPSGDSDDDHVVSNVAGMQRPSFGPVQRKILIYEFGGVRKINSLEAYPIQYHPNPEQLKARLLERGRKWVSFKGIHHMHYSGTAAITAKVGGRKQLMKYNVSTSSNQGMYVCIHHPFGTKVNSRIVVDRGPVISRSLLCF